MAVGVKVNSGLCSREALYGWIEVISHTHVIVLGPAARFCQTVLAAVGCLPACSPRKVPALTVHPPSAESDAGDMNGQDTDPKSCTPGSSCPPTAYSTCCQSPLRTAICHSAELQLWGGRNAQCIIVQSGSPGLQQCLELPVAFTPAAGHICHTAAPEHVRRRWEGSYDWVACVIWLHVPGPSCNLPHVMTAALT